MPKAKPVPGLRADLPYARAAATTVRVRAGELLERAEMVERDGSVKNVHRMRVATRRLRAVLEIYAPCFPRKDLKRTLREVKGLADALGARRDPDVQLEGIERFAELVSPEDRPGLDAFVAAVGRVRDEGDETLARALETLDREGLAARLEALAAAAEQAAEQAAEVPLLGTASPDGEPAATEAAA